MTDITDVNNVYLNVVFQGPDPGGLLHSVAATQDITRTQAIIDKPSEWFFSVIRLTLPLNSEPIYIMPVFTVAQGNSPFNPLLTPYVIGIAFGAAEWYGASLLWQPEIVTNGFLDDDTTPSDWSPNNAFYWMFSYDTLVSMVNAAVGVAFAAFIVVHPAFTAAGQPWLSFDAATGLLTWTYPTSWSTPPNQSGKVPVPATPRLGQNIALQSILDGFRNLLVNVLGPTTAVNSPLYANDPLNLQEMYIATQNPQPPVAAYFKVEQTTSDVATWNSVRRIIVTSASLPIVQEIVPAPPSAAPTLQFNNPQPDGSRSLVSSPASSGGASSYPIVCDLIVASDSSADLRGLLTYVPNAQYRWVDLLSPSPLYRLDLTLSWVDTLGNIHPIQLARNQQASLKIAFVKKPMVLHPKPGLPAKTAISTAQEAADREEQLRRYREASSLRPAGRGHY